jgi:hypothetical protein
MTAEAAAAHGIHVGTRMVWDPGIQRVGRLLVGKAMDDRLGVAVLPFEAVAPRDVESAVRLFEAYLTGSAPE